MMCVVPHSVPSCCTQYICASCIIYSPLCHVLHCRKLSSGVVLETGLQCCTCPFGLSLVSVVDYNRPKYNYFGTVVLALAHGLQSICLAWPSSFLCTALRLFIICTWFMDFSTLSAVSSSRALSTLSRESNVSFSLGDP